MNDMKKVADVIADALEAEGVKLLPIPEHRRKLAGAETWVSESGTVQICRQYAIMIDKYLLRIRLGDELS